ncbi:hypothetical protein [Enterococcus sp. HY326]|uniref:hypothetical protein n=1 Tax=Enterococcus sp. HY326 TaxID=2971265 RepID=UPI0022406587|nr:hypothetical protein [Enterococcus sp. HY326]
MKKKLTLSACLFALMIVGTACNGSNSQEGTEDNQGGQKLTSKDVVSQKDEVLDGEEVTVYEMKDGSNVILPKGVDMDDAGAVIPDEKNIQSYSSEDLENE